MAINLFKYYKPRGAKAIPPVPAKVWQDPLYFIAFGFGSGAMPFAPGTFGTLIAIPFYLAMRPLSLTPYLVILAIIIVLSMWLSSYISKQIDVHDHPGMCIDEIVGFLVTMINAPLGWPWIVLGFLLFRFFDIVKPWPISIIDEKIHGGFGMILDDIVAGVLANIIIQLLGFFR